MGTLAVFLRSDLTRLRSDWKGVGHRQSLETSRLAF